MGNVPVINCAIVRAVKCAADSGKRFTRCELLFLAYIKVPCVIHHIVSILPVKREDRTRLAWVVALNDAIDTFKLRGAVKKQHRTYRAQRKNVGLGCETTAGPQYMHGHLVHMSDTDFSKCMDSPLAWESTAFERLASDIKKAPFSLRGTAYKQSHALRTVAAAVGGLMPTGFDDRHLGMSMSLVAKREAFYPIEARDSPAAGVGWLHAQCAVVLTSLGVTDTTPFDHLLKNIKNMSRGSECCFVCESAKAVHLNARHVSAMEVEIKTCKEWGGWRYGVKWEGGCVKEDAQTGAFCGIGVSADALCDSTV